MCIGSKGNDKYWQKHNGKDFFRIKFLAANCKQTFLLFVWKVLGAFLLPHHQFNTTRRVLNRMILCRQQQQRNFGKNFRKPRHTELPFSSFFVGCFLFPFVFAHDDEEDFAEPCRNTDFAADRSSCVREASLCWCCISNLFFLIFTFPKQYLALYSWKALYNSNQNFVDSELSCNPFGPTAEKVASRLGAEKLS